MIDLQNSVVHSLATLSKLVESVTHSLSSVNGGCPDNAEIARFR